MKKIITIVMYCSGDDNELVTDTLERNEAKIMGAVTRIDKDPYNRCAYKMNEVTGKHVLKNLNFSISMDSKEENVKQICSAKIDSKRRLCIAFHEYPARTYHSYSKNIPI